MSESLSKLAEEFLGGKLNADEFVDAYLSLWKRERDSGDLLQDESSLSEALSTIFCFADLYNPRDDRDEYELDEKQLRAQVEKALRNILK